MCGYKMPEHERFPYLIHIPGREGKSVIKEYGGRAEIIRRRLMIVWSEQSKHFYVFKRVSEYLAFSDQVPARDRHYYEVIFSEQRQRPKIDIDGGSKESAERIRRKLRDMADGDKVIVCDSSAGRKFSRHLIVDKFYKDAASAKVLMDDVVANLNEDDAKYIDQSVYKDIQYFRLTGSAKMNGAIKKILTPGVTFEQTLIGSYPY
jgi:hypothetical protein